MVGFSHVFVSLLPSPSTCAKAVEPKDGSCASTRAHAPATTPPLTLVGPSAAKALIPQPLPEFGHAMKSTCFKLAESCMDLNHGSYGAIPIPVLSYQRLLVERTEERPDLWFRLEYKELLKDARKALARKINAPNVDDVVFAENASAAINAILRSMPLGSESKNKVLVTSFAYEMIKNVIRHMGAREGLEATEVVLPWPIHSQDEIYNCIEETLKREGEAIKLVVLDHVSSAPAVVFDVKRIAALCHRYGIPVLVDGAHALGAVPVDVTDMDVDFYVTNCHKWSFSPRGAAVLYAKKEMQQHLVPSVVSSSSKWDYVGAFEYTGTRDYTPYVSTLAALEFTNAVGQERIMEYNHELAVWAGEYLAGLFGTELGAPAEMTGSMVNIALPDCVNSDDAGNALAGRLMQDYDTYLIVFSTDHKRQYLRLSAQIYTEKADFVRLGQLISNILQLAPSTTEAST